MLQVRNIRAKGHRCSAKTDLEQHALRKAYFKKRYFGGNRMCRTRNTGFFSIGRINLMFRYLLTPCILAFLFIGTTARAQVNPLDLIFKDTVIQVYIPPSLDMREGTFQLIVGAKTDDGEEISHRSLLKFVHGDSGKRLRDFIVLPEDIIAINDIRAQIQAWKDTDIHGEASFDIDFKICKYHALPKENIAFYFSTYMPGVPDDLTTFAKIDFASEELAESFTEETVQPCNKKVQE